MSVIGDSDVPEESSRNLKCFTGSSRQLLVTVSAIHDRDSDVPEEIFGNLK